MADRAEIDRVRDATDLVELIGAHVSLEAKGREHVGLCPFHDDHKPSMAVVTHRDQSFYKCFSCGAGGDAFTFVCEYLKMSFGEALEYLAERAGITLSNRPTTAKDTKQRELRDLVRRANDRATAFFQSTLGSDAGTAARAMIAARGISDEMVDAFQLGAHLCVGRTSPLAVNNPAYEAARRRTVKLARRQWPLDSFRAADLPICPRAAGGLRRTILDPE